MSSEENDAIDWMANELYQKDMRRRGFSGGTRWWCTRPEVKERWRDVARKAVKTWADNERATAKRNELPEMP